MELFSIQSLTSAEISHLKAISTFPFYREGDYLMLVSRRGKLFAAKAISRFFSVGQIIRDMETGLYSDDLYISTRFGAETVTVPRSIFSLRNFEVLNERGLQYDASAVPMLLKYVTLSEMRATVLTQYQSVGWVRPEKGATKFFGLSSDDSLQYVGDKDLSSSGSLADYVAGINELVAGHVGLEVCLATSISSAVVGLLSTQGSAESIMIHFYGNSSCGKTTALQLAASVWGNPEMGKGILSSWNATSNALLAKLDHNHGVVACWDESSALSRDFSSIIYAISQNTGKSRLSKTSQLQKERKFCTSIISSGENSLLAASNKNTGLRARLLEFFDSPLTDSASHSDAIKNFVVSEHGTLGAAVVNLLSQSDTPPVAEMLQAWEERLKKRLTGQYVLEDRIISKYAIILLSADLVCSNLGVQFHLQSMETFLIDTYRSLATEQDIGRNAYDYIISWLVKNNSHIAKKDYLPALASVDGIYISENWVALLKPSFEKILHDGGFTDTTVVAQELKRLDLLKPESKDRLTARVVINGIRVPCYRLKVNSTIPISVNAEGKI